MDFKKEYAEWVLNGKKTQTLRKHCDYELGDTFKVSNEYLLGSPILKTHEMKITSIEKVNLHELTEEDAIREGFKSLPELVLALKEIYSDLEASSLLYRIRFEKVLSEDEELEKIANEDDSDG